MSNGSIRHPWGEHTDDPVDVAVDVVADATVDVTLYY
jgi:hypothetical protein